MQTSVGGQTDTQQFCYDDLSRLTWSGTNGTPPCSGTSITAGTLTGAQYQQSNTYTVESGLVTGPAGSYNYGDSAHPHAVTSTSNGYSATYDAAGNLICRALTMTTSCSGATPSGQQLSYDAQGRLSLRYYDPGVGQFLSVDSVQGNAQGMDPYAYVGGNPESKVDPTGQRRVAPDGSTSWTNPDGTIYEESPGGNPTVIGHTHGSPSNGGGTTITQPTATATPQPTATATPIGNGGHKGANGGRSGKSKCAFMCGGVNGWALTKGISEFLGGALGLAALIAIFNGGIAVTGGLALLVANYIKSAIAQAVRLILVGLQDIFDSAAEHNPWVDVVLDGLKIVADVLTLAFGISDTAKLISNIRNGSGLLGKAKFLMDEAGDFFAGQGTQIKGHAGLLVSATNGFVAAAATILGGEVVPDGLQFAGDLQNALNY